MKARMLSEAKCLRVIDGDTILVDMRCPCCQVWSQQRVRLARIDAPELNGPRRHEAETARAWLRDQIHGKPIQLGVSRAWPDRYGRVLAEVMIDGRNMSNELIQAGLARPYNTDRVPQREREPLCTPRPTPYGLPPLADAEDGETWPARLNVHLDAVKAGTEEIAPVGQPPICAKCGLRHGPDAICGPGFLIV